MYSSIILLIAVIFGVPAGDSVRVHYKDGTKVLGSVLRETPEVIIIEMPLGLLQIDRERIDRVEQLEEKAPPEGGDPAAPAAGAEGRTSAPANTPAAPAPGGSPDTKRSNEVSPAELPAKKPLPDGTEVDEELDPQPPDSELNETDAASGEDSPPVVSSHAGAPKAAGGFASFSGRLIDRYSWAQELPHATALSVILGVIVLLWAGLGVGCRICDVAAGAWQVLPAALLWGAILIGLLFVRGWNPMLLGGVSATLGIAWIVTAKGMLRATAFQVLSLGVLFVFGCGVSFLLIEVGQHLLELPGAV